MSDAKQQETEETPTGTQREFREYARGNLDVDHHDVHPIAGLIHDDEVRDVLAFMAEHYEPPTDEDGRVVDGFPKSFWDTDFAQRATRKYATKTATKAVTEDNVSQLSYITGLPSYKSDVSGIHAINQLADWMTNNNCNLIYVAALMGKGKTDFCLLLLEIVLDHFERVESATDSDTEVPQPEFATNFEVNIPDDVDVEIKEFHTYSELKEWAESGSSDDERWFIFDEASTELTAQSGANAQQVAEVFSPFVKKMRKCGINMIVIGHDRGDVHPAIRSIASFIDKVSLKSADVYQGIKSREPHGHVMSISGIPETSWGFETDDVASWEWDQEPASDGDDVEDYDGISEQEWIEWRNSRIAAIYGATDLSQYDVGQLFDVSQTTVSNILKDVNKDDIEVEKAPEDPKALAD